MIWANGLNYLDQVEWSFHLEFTWNKMKEISVMQKKEYFSLKNIWLYWVISSICRDFCDALYICAIGVQCFALARFRQLLSIGAPKQK